MAEGQGFEPWEPLGSPVFKTGAIDHSATPPMWCAFYILFESAQALDYKKVNYFFYDL